ncbi:hypothetical protein AMEX_G23829 [Astyanax mexicanus]|uniref:Ig-like domain-containing protein n=1 Tax=Astyanax mexicanus TaxID=7994 RepID=A0A8T2KSP5_ASTMX|nr:hypothetical protein AMEX_G23829 [Astyanax mexicanus]
MTACKQHHALSLCAQWAEERKWPLLDGIIRVCCFKSLVAGSRRAMAAWYSAAVFLAVLTFCKPSSPEPYNIMNVRYSRDPVGRTEGQSLTLKCTVEYNINQCFGLRNGWFLENKQELMNPHAYLIRINETKMSNNPEFRRRDVTITFKRLFLNDSGLYQCVGKCADGPSAMGHLINLTVTEKKDDLLASDLNRSDRDTADIILLILSGFILSWMLLM